MASTALSSSMILKPFLATRLNQSRTVTCMHASSSADQRGNKVLTRCRLGLNEFADFGSCGIHQRTLKSLDKVDVGYSPEDLKSMDKQMELFESWMTKHNKIYDSNEEKLFRFKIFTDMLKYIEETNKVLTTFRVGLNQFSDLTDEEFENIYLNPYEDQDEDEVDTIGSEEASMGQDGYLQIEDAETNIPLKENSVTRQAHLSGTQLA
ncbi:hypothetical protein PIB30_027935 [Stylosanthes scabra]|uniref:Cathepsin propeptide inhibitor domain-containing protein n=1 Tax=Stylosanthes scabra TaxID=79078 RepID=A0ABU6SB00_9FABA|nr:hypothetical protein [Stylosanthes scabra]